jgi:acetyltransferase-like isoleucine patch superfamily enzyme
VLTRLVNRLAGHARGHAARARCLRGGGRVSWRAELHLAEDATLEVGRGSAIRRGSSVLVGRGGSLRLGCGTAMMQDAEIVVGPGAALRIGDDVYVGAFANLRCVGRITIGDGVRLAQFVSIVDANYKFKDRHAPIDGFDPSVVTIGNGAWIGAQVVLLPGVEIGEGAVVGAGSVVTKSVPAFAIAVGNPARVSGYRS